MGENIKFTVDCSLGFTMISPWLLKVNALRPDTGSFVTKVTVNELGSFETLIKGKGWVSD